MRLFTADRIGVGKQVFEEIFCRYGPKIGEWDGKETKEKGLAEPQWDGLSG